MKSLLRFLFLLGLVGCAPQLNQYHKDELAAIANDLKNVASYLNHGDLARKYPNYSIFSEKVLSSEVHTKLEKEIARTSPGAITSQVVEKNGRCGIAKVFERDTSTFYRVRYIYLDSPGKPGERLADSILTMYHSGRSFVDLVKQFTRDGSIARDGDLGWFERGMMVKDFQDPIERHEKGEIFKLNTDKFGWYVVLKTHNHSIFEYTRCIFCIKENCT